MRKTPLDFKGFAATELLMIIVAVIVIGGAGGYVYHANHKNKTMNTSSQKSTKTTTSGNGGTSKAATPPANPYAGWETASLKYEQATFKYPASWQISNTAKDETQTGGVANPGADSVTLTSPTGLLVSIHTGESYAGDASGMVSVLPGAQPVQMLGDTYYLDFYALNGSTDAEAACLDKSATPDNTIPYITSKNITLAPNSPAADAVCVEYQNAQGGLVAKPVSAFEQDTSYDDAKLIIESLSY